MGHFWTGKCNNTKILQNFFVLFFEKFIWFHTFKRNIKVTVFLFLGQLWLCPKNPSLDILVYKIAVVLIVLFFLIILMLEPKFYCCFVLVLCKKQKITAWFFKVFLWIPFPLNFQCLWKMFFPNEFLIERSSSKFFIFSLKSLY